MKITVKIKTPHKMTAKFKELKMPLRGGFEEGYNQGYAAGYENGKASVKDYFTELLHNTLEICESEDVISVKQYTFADATSLKKISFPNCLALDKSAFQSCGGLQEINLPKCEIIGNSSFAWCSKMATVCLPRVTDMQARAFYYCNALKTLIIAQDKILCPLGNIDALKGTLIEKGTGYIYVPAAFVEQYKAATNWSTYASQIRAIEDYPEITGG